MGELSYVYFYPFFWHGILPTKKSPHWSLLHAFILSKIESTIENLLSWALQKSTRSYHNGVFRHHPIDKQFGSIPTLGRLCSEYSAMCLPWIPSISKVFVNPKISHISFYGLHHLRTPSHNTHFTP